MHRWGCESGGLGGRVRWFPPLQHKIYCGSVHHKSSAHSTVWSSYQIWTCRVPIPIRANMHKADGGIWLILSGSHKKPARHIYLAFSPPSHSLSCLASPFILRSRNLVLVCGWLLSVHCCLGSTLVQIINFREPARRSQWPDTRLYCVI